MSADSLSNPFTKSWIQALTAAAEHPITRTIKPKLDWIDQLSLNRAEGNRTEAARELWDYGEQTGLTSLLKVLPVGSDWDNPNTTQWQFPEDEMFLFGLRQIAKEEATDSDAFQRWCQQLGIVPLDVPMFAEVTATDWSNLVRQEAVRLQKSFNPSAVASKSTMQIECVGSWDLTQWEIRFASVDWLGLQREDPIACRRPELEHLFDTLIFALGEVEKALMPKSTPGTANVDQQQPWLSCVDRLTPLHEHVLGARQDFSPWLRHAWSCVWPIVYRQQAVLRGQADLDQVRASFSECIAAVPKLTVGLLVYARLVCQIQNGMGLGICADFVD